MTLMDRIRRRFGAHDQNLDAEADDANPERKRDSRQRSSPSRRRKGISTFGWVRDGVGNSPDRDSGRGGGGFEGSCGDDV